MRGERLLRRAVCGDRDADRQRGGLGHQRAVGQAGELDEPDAVGDGLDPRERLDGQARLPAASRPDEREQAHSGEQAEDLAALALAAHEGGQRLGQVAARLAGGLGRQQLAVERAGLGVGLGRQLGVELLAQQLVLRERLLAAPGRRVQAHEGAVGGLGQRVGDQRALQRRHRLRVVAVQLGQLDAQGAVELEQGCATGVGPGLVAVLGQQLAGMQVEGGLVVGGLAGGARVDGGGLEGVDVDLGLEGDDAVGEAQGLGSDRPAGRVQGLVEVVGRGFGVAIGPQQIGQALAVHAALGRQGQELDQRLGLAQAPRAFFDDAVLGGDREPAQQTHARCGVVHPGAPSVDEPTVSWSA